MPRKAFIADYEAAKQQGIHGITDVSRGENDEDINVTFMPQNGVPIELCLLAQPDVGSYPNETFFMIFARTSDPPPGIAAALEDISGFSHGVKIPELIATISQKLRAVLATGAKDAPILLDGSDVEMLDGTDDEEDGEYSEEEYGDYGGFSDDDERGGSKVFTSATHRISPEAAVKLNRRIRHDLRAARFAGFSIGILNGMKADSISSLVSLSIRVAKLGLSEEAIQAWDLEPQQYIVLLIRYSNGYKTFESVISDPAKLSDTEFRIGVCNKYKPTIVEALAAFTDVTRDKQKDFKGGSGDANQKGMTDSNSGFANFFISSSLNDFSNSQFISLLKMRYNLGVGWDGAKKFMGDKAGRVGEHSADLPSEYYAEDNPAQDSLPGVLTADHLTEIGVKELSFPLIFAQFALRYLSRCTEFCLVCHDKIEEEFGALKPYVCSKPLCLYQYMSLGFGPSVEHEILTQPYVVDLLVSFCYTAAMQRKLREYPTGMSLNVPPVATFVTADYQRHFMGGGSGVGPGSVTAAKQPNTPLDITFDAGHQEVLFTEELVSPVHRGDWVTVTLAGRLADHYRVEDTSLFPKIKLSPNAVTRWAGIVGAVPNQDTVAVPATPATTPPPFNFQPAKMTIYNSNFDEMSDAEKAETIVMALETLPSITALRTYLTEQSRSSEPNLRAWKERVSPAALGILRWIIASNRSCIVQVDKCPGQGDAEVAAARIRLNQRVANISESWVQFRFAQGSPDKEQKFLNALKAQQNNFDAKYPTMFAFHGSPLPNWHSIIRHGLDFKETLHGRAYGNGVYHSQDQNVSIGYAMHGASMWHGSSLKISSAMSLNEIVNCPTQFTSSQPHLVVQHIDWIQCRYLFVQVASTGEYVNGVNSAAVSHVPGATDQVVEQDPKFLARSTLQKPIGVPLCAVAVSRAFRVNAATAIANATPDQLSGKKKRKTTLEKDALGFIDMATSEEEDISDINFLFSEDEDDGKSKIKQTNINLNEKGLPMTDFQPGTLDQSQLPILDPPSYATASATKSLTRALKEVVEIQKKTPLHELGWYIDAELINNVYQWIVELHSFDPSLPLAKEMKQAGMSSIVLEIRFGKEFPFSPPFVRVIRPRFLPFQQGGGGHVTAGGAICMELLTNSGWSSVSSLESVLLQVRLAISSTDPRPAHLESVSSGRKIDYGTGEAVDAYLRACQMHGWQVPPGFRDEFGGGPSRGPGGF